MVNDEKKNLDDPMLEFLSKHKEYLTTVRRWDEYAKEHNFPPSSELIRTFKSWNSLKSILGLRENVKKYSKDDLLRIAKLHQKHFTSKRKWNLYAKENNLPVDQTYIKSFGSWNKVKDILDIEHTSTARPLEYTKEDIIHILKVHGKNLINRKQWDDYAKKNNLPTYKTVRKHFSSWEEVLSFTEKEDKKSTN